MFVGSVDSNSCGIICGRYHSPQERSAAPKGGRWSLSSCMDVLASCPALIPTHTDPLSRPVPPVTPLPSQSLVAKKLASSCILFPNYCLCCKYFSALIWTHNIKIWELRILLFQVFGIHSFDHVSSCFLQCPGLVVML